MFQIPPQPPFEKGVESVSFDRLWGSTPPLPACAQPAGTPNGFASLVQNGPCPTELAAGCSRPCLDLWGLHWALSK
jgi:hypothetical protein